MSVVNINGVISFLFGDIWGIVICTLVFIISWYVWQRLTTTLPPGPIRVPLLGYIPLTFNTKPPLKVLQQLAEKYKHVTTVYIGPIPFVVLNDFETVKDTFVTKQNDFAGRPYNFTGDLTSEGSKDIALADFGPQWSLHRRLAMVALKKFADKNTVSYLVCESANDLCQMMISETLKHGKTENVEKHIYLLIYNVIASIVFGKKFEENDNDFVELTTNIAKANEAFATGLLGDIIPALGFLPTPGKKKLIASMDKIQNVLKRYIAEHKRTLDINNARDITDSILIARAELEQEGKEEMAFFTDVHERQTISDIFFAGTDTTCFTLQWVILYCMVYPDMQEKVYAEIKANVGDRMITPEDRTMLQYTEAFLLEVMRVRPIAPLSIPHGPTTPTASVGQYRIPKGTNVVPNIWACHFDSKYWPEPEQFKPERFIVNGKVVSKPDSFLPFSIGRRACAGEQLARVDTLLIFATLIQKAKFSVVDGCDNPTLEPLAVGSGFACVVSPYEVKVENR